ncbi:hypothetical protein CMV_010398 [Castanea mollissima]|uniref:Uncharacterized protein n=1 Tax=Castanea mollissima TaxID=60419 RepID=A0A8J4VPN7_9ROSI|nr:hypothetical protein CMV_010398 [Castanea mollissima]
MSLVRRGSWRFGPNRGAADFESADHVENAVNRSADATVSPPRCFVLWVADRLVLVTISVTWDGVWMKKWEHRWWWWWHASRIESIAHEWVSGFV